MSYLQSVDRTALVSARIAPCSAPLCDSPLSVYHASTTKQPVIKAISVPLITKFFEFCILLTKFANNFYIIQKYLNEYKHSI